MNGLDAYDIFSLSMMPILFYYIQEYIGELFKIHLPPLCIFVTSIIFTVIIASIIF